MTREAGLETEARGPLKGLRVLDLTSVVFGAYATQTLGDFGADVIKVEPPASGQDRGGDIMRWAGSAPDPALADLGPIFMSLNRNKRSLVLDLAAPEGRDVVLELARGADAFITTIRYEGLKRLGLAYEDLKAVRPDIVYAHGSGYGSDGPYAGRPAYDDLIQSASGLADLLPRVDGDPRPRLLPALIADKVAGLFMGQAVIAALFHRLKSGEGQFLEAPMFECLTSFNLVEHLFGHVYEPPTGPYAYGRVANPNRKPFRTRDGYIGLMPYTDDNWRKFFALAGWTETVGRDPRFATPLARSHNSEALYGLLEEVTPTRTTDEWLELLTPLGIPAARTNRLDELMNDPHLAAVGLFETLEHPDAGSYRSLRSPVRFSATPPDVRRHPPRFGEHTEEILREAGAPAPQRR